MCPILGPTELPLFWISGDSFKAMSGLPYSHCGSQDERYIPRGSTSECYTCQPLDGRHGHQLCLHILLPAEVMLPGFELMPSEYL